VRIDGHFPEALVPDGTLVVTDGAQITQAVIEVAVSKDKWNGGSDIHALRNWYSVVMASVTGDDVAGIND